MSEIITLKDFAEPSAFVHLYKDSPEALAISFGSFIEYKLRKKPMAVPEEIADSISMLGLTEYHEALLQALGEVFSGFKQYGCKVLPLVEEMGFGKTHFIILLFHLFTDVPAKWDELLRRPELSEEIRRIKESGYEPRRAENTILIPIDVLYLVGKDNPYQEFVNIIIDACNYKNLGELAKEVEELKDRDPISFASELVDSVFDKHLNLLILVDEIYAGVKESIKSDDERRISTLKNVLTALTHIADIVANKVPTVIVYASAQQDVDAWNRLSSRLEASKPESRLDVEKINLVSAVKDFERRSGRKAVVGLKTTKPSHAVRICAKRLLKISQNQEKIIAKMRENIVPVLRILIKDEGAIEHYFKKLNETWPFTPEFELLAEKLMQPAGVGDLPKSQHLRDLLRICSISIDRLVGEGLWDHIALISPLYLTHDDLKHLLPINISQGWERVYNIGRKAIDGEKDENLRALLSLMHTSLYLRAITANVARVIDLIRRPDALAMEELRVRGANAEELRDAVIGVVDSALLAETPKAISAFSSNKIPFVIPIERGGVEYFVLSLVSNPAQFIESFKQEELSKMKSMNGSFSVQRIFDYLAEHLSKSNFTSALTEEIQKQGLYPLILDANILMKDKEIEENLTARLNDDIFSLAVIHPTTLASLHEDVLSNLSTYVKDTLVSNRNKIKFANMLAVVVPRISTATLMDLCTCLAEVSAAQRLIEYFKEPIPERAQAKRKQLAEKMPTYPLIKESLTETTSEKDFEMIIDEVMSYLQNRIENYAATLAADKLTSYVVAFTSIFRDIVHFNPKQDRFVIEEIGIKTAGRGPIPVKELYAYIPKWLCISVKSTCQISDAAELRSFLLDYLAKEAQRNAEVLLEGKEVSIPFSFLLNALKKGWKEIPVKPISSQQVEVALKSLSGVHPPVEDPRLRDLVVEVHDEQLILIIRKTEIPPPPPPPGILGIKVSGVDNVIIGLSLTEKEANIMSHVSLSLNMGEGSASFIKLKPSELKEIAGDYGSLGNRLGKMRNKISNASLTLTFQKSLDNKSVENLCKKYGLKGFELLLEKV
jgi:hypothetical protein